MKKIILFSSIFFLSCLFSFSQNEWAPLGAKWYYSLPDTYGNPFTDVLIYHSKKDTLINSKQFKVAQSGRDTLLFHHTNDSVQYLFEDQIYLAYYFGGEEKDTITIDFIASLPNPIEPTELVDSVIQVDVIIDSIDFIINNSVELKKVFGSIIQDTRFPELVWPLYYIYSEKIGNEDYLIPKLHQPSILTKILQFRCYEDSVISYKSTFWEAQSKPCDYISASSIHYTVSNYNIYPNPVSNWLIIESNDDSILHKSLLQIYSVDGKLILQQRISKKLTSIETSIFETGFYVLKLYKPGEVITTKIFKL